MSDWKAKRFWTNAEVTAAEGGWQVLLDGRQVRTPAKAALLLPSHALALAIAAEWQAQNGRIDPRSMPVTRTANSAIDKVMPQRDEVAEMLIGYGGSDLLCYRAIAPEELSARQSALWDPVLAWAEQRYGARLALAAGVMPVAQPELALQRLAEPVREMSAFHLAAFHDLVALSGSLVLALAVIDGHLDPADAWSLSRLDEAWQIEQWGADEEAAEAAEIKSAAFFGAAAFWSMLNQPDPV